MPPLSMRRRLPRRRLPQIETRRPSAPPASDRSTLSASSWRISWPREAPSAMRIAYSRIRPTVRASWRLARLTHAIPRTKSMSPMMVHRIWADPLEREDS